MLWSPLKKKRNLMNTERRHTRIPMLLLLLVATTGIAMGQRQKIRNLPYYDQRRLHWGFSFGLDLPDVTFRHSGQESGEGWWAACPKVNPSFMVGLMGDLAITEHLNFRVTPFFLFQQRNVTFARSLATPIYDYVLDEFGQPQSHPSGQRVSREQKVQQLKTSYITVPFSLKVSTRRINNYRPYMVAGVNVAFDLGHSEEEPIVFQRLDYGLHFGLGCDFYLPFFKLAPELRFNVGLRDMLDHERKNLKDETMRPFPDAIQSARNNGISLILWFE